MTHTYLQSTESGMIVLVSEKEKPERDNFSRYAKKSGSQHFEVALKLWTEACQKYPVAQGEEEKFQAFIIKSNDNICFYEQLQRAIKEAIKLPNEVVEIKDGMACFKEPKADDLWPSDEDIGKFVNEYQPYFVVEPLTGAEIFGAISGIQKFVAHLKKEFNLTRKL